MPNTFSEVMKGFGCQIRMIRIPFTLVGAVLLSCFVAFPTVAFGQSSNGEMTDEKALILAEKFGVDVGEVDEELREFLGSDQSRGCCGVCRSLEELRQT